MFDDGLIVAPGEGAHIVLLVVVELLCQRHHHPKCGHVPRLESAFIRVADRADGIG